MKKNHGIPNLHVFDHPLIQHKLSLMRDKNTPTIKFRQLLKEIALLMGYEVTRFLPLTYETIETPLMTIEAPVIAGKKIAVVPILRAGLGMAEGLIDLIPSARVGHIGLYRGHETKRPIQYFVKLPETNDRIFILVDPMMATGYSAIEAVNILNRHGVDNKRIIFMSLIASPEGIQKFNQMHPEILVYLAALDDKLNEHAYILPGLGDAGDRLFGTK
ncbi:MAG: uracil phosphoribosyltransferase [Alphaproteobacteria bacterium]|nr:uracil phosphoribosyltransferase [Alphaproteobacteria bacterium]